MPNITIQETARHRNGVAGVGFFVITFRDEDEDREMVGVIFDLPDEDELARERGEFVNPPTAVFDREML
jgi:hypothetical protein